MMETMMSGIKTDGPFGGGQGEKVFRSIMIRNTARKLPSKATSVLPTRFSNNC